MIRLYGSLARKFERKYKSHTRLPINVSSIAELVRAMEANFPGFKQLIRKKGLYHIVRGADLEKGRTVRAREVEMTFNDTDWHILPVAAGCGGKGGVVQTIIGAVLFVAGAVMQNPALMQVGLAMTLGGVAQMMAPSPGGALDRENPEEKPSYLFNGPVNTIEPGTTIGVGYGEFFAGTITVSGGIKVEQL